MIRPLADNVVIRLEPLETETASGIALVPGKRDRRGHRTAIVIASGPGHYRQVRRTLGDGTPYTTDGPFVPNEVKPGDRVVVDALAGQNYDLDINIPRHNKGAEFAAIADARGEFRIVREQEILGVVES